MKKTLILNFTLAVITGCAMFNKSPRRTTHTTLDGLGRSVSLAESEYVEGVLLKRYKTNGFPEVQRSYGLFQLMYSNAVWVASRDVSVTNIPPQLNMQAYIVVEQIKNVKGLK